MKVKQFEKWIYRLELIIIPITIIALVLLAFSTQGIDIFEKLNNVLKIISQFGIGILLFVVIFYIFRLTKNYINKSPGSGLSINLLLKNLFFSSFPILFISYFAIKFISYRFEASFDQRIDDALNNALVLSDKALLERRSKAILNTEEVPKIMLAKLKVTGYFNNNEPELRLEEIRKFLNFDQLTIFNQNGFVQSHSSTFSSESLPSIINKEEIAFAEYRAFNILEKKENEIQIRTIVRFDEKNSLLELLNKNELFYVQSIVVLPDTISNLTKQVRETVEERDKFNYIRPKVSNGFISVLILIIFLSILLLILSSIALSDYMVRPIRNLIRATVKVRKGNFDIEKQKITRKDDFGTLLKSFQKMTLSLKDANERAESSQILLESQRSYLATVIEHISSPVMTIDRSFKLLMFNEQAEKLLKCSLEKYVKKTDLDQNNYRNFINSLKEDFVEIQNQKKSITKEISILIDHIQTEFYVKISELPNEKGGFVIIFESIAEFKERQKAEAWSEVARRLAHEIKNPLTPIQLATERLNYKLSSSLNDEKKAVLEKSTKIIINQVRAMQNMVDDFSQFAKPSKSDKYKIFNIEDLLREVLELYSTETQNYEIRVNFQANSSKIKGDETKLRQVFHNILKNAVEATLTSENARIEITTGLIEKKIVIEIKDNGLGIENKQENTIFEPYVTTKEKGTGLGLAIVKKIMSDHDGNVILRNNKETGVTVSLTFPLT